MFGMNQDTQRRKKGVEVDRRAVTEGGLGTRIAGRMFALHWKRHRCVNLV